MTVPVGTIIGASTKIAEYFGLIEGVNTLITSTSVPLKRDDYQISY